MQKNRCMYKTEIHRDKKQDNYSLSQKTLDLRMGNHLFPNSSTASTEVAK